MIKSAKSDSTYLSLFELMGDDETALAKSFAYILSAQKAVYFAFIHLLRLPFRYSDSHYNNLSVKVETSHPEGRTDIELSVQDNLHIIIECKVREAGIGRQRTQYLDCFQENANVKVMCFLTQDRGTSLLVNERILFKHISWLDIAEMLNTRAFLSLPPVQEFLSYAQRHYQVSYMREILIQDLGDATELRRFTDFNVYRRDESYVTPLYFAPHFTRYATGFPEGISCLSKVLGILTFNPTATQDIRGDLQSYAGDAALVDKWYQGVQLGSQPDTMQTYFFLDNPLKLRKPLRKAHRRNSANWIGSSVPKNRCVSFIDFIQHMPEFNEQ